MCVKERTLRLVKNALSNAEDDLYRANLQFGRMTTKQFNQEWGRSGRSCGEILLGYREEVDELKQALVWVNTR
jgi:hypothetical protein